MSVGELVSLFNKVTGQQTASLLKRYCFTVTFQVFCQYIFKYFGSSCFLVHTSEWLLPVCGKCTSQESCVKICVKEGSIFCFVFVFWGYSFCTTFYCDFLKLGIAPLMLKILLNIFFIFLFRFKTQISYYILIDDSVIRFLKMFHILLHHFNCPGCLETKIMTMSTDINFISNNVKGIQNSLKRLKIFNY